jgi:hypothetical protein
VRVFEGSDGLESDYGTDIMIRHFLKMASLLDDWTRVADKALQRAGKDASVSPEVLLIGRHLPELFERTYRGRRFGLSRSGRQITGEGVEFVRAALKAMKIRSSRGEDWSKETIASYRTRAQKTL